jgi:hypothetical protein
MQIKYSCYIPSRIQRSCWSGLPLLSRGVHFSWCCAYTEPETLEGMDCLEALVLVEDCGIRRITVASDRLNIVRNINEMPLCAYVMILKDI